MQVYIMIQLFSNSYELSYYVYIYFKMTFNSNN